MRVLAIAALSLGLCGCIAAGEQRQLQALRDKDAETCKTMGAATQAQLFQCKLTFETQRRNAIAMSDAADDAVAAQNRQAVANQLMFGRR